MKNNKEKLKEIMLDRNLSKQDVANILKVSVSSIFSYLAKDKASSFRMISNEFLHKIKNSTENDTNRKFIDTVNVLTIGR